MGKNAKTDPAPQAPFKARLIKHESNIRKAETQAKAQKKVSGTKLKGGQEVLKVILPAPPVMFYKRGVQDLIYQAMDQCGTKVAAADEIGISPGHIYSLTRADPKKRSNAGPKTIAGLSRLCGVEIGIRKQFYIRHLVKNEDE